MNAPPDALLLVALLIAIGVLLRFTVLRGEDQWRGIEQLTYYALFPALIVETLVKADMRAVAAARTGLALFLAILLMTGLLLALWPLLRARLSGPAFTSLMQGATRWNSFIALAVAGGLYGQTGVALTAVAIIAMVPVLNVINVAALARWGTAARPSLSGVLLALLKNPLIWSCLLGISINLARLPLPSLAMDALNALGRGSLAIGLVMVGAGLDLRRLLKPGFTVLGATALKLLAMPLIAIAIGRMLGLDGVSLQVVAICSSVPSAANGYVLARQMGGDAPLLAQILTVQTLAAFLTMPAMIALASRL